MYTIARRDVYGQSAPRQTRAPFVTVTPCMGQTPIRTKPQGYRACDLGLGPPTPPEIEDRAL